MAYPATTKTLQTWVQDVDKQASILKNATQQQFNFSAAGQLDMDLLRRYYDLLKQSHVFFTSAAAVTGIGTYLNDEKQGTVSDPVAEFVAMQAAVAHVIAWLNTNVPEDTFSGTVYKLGFVFPADNTTPSSSLVFTAAQTAGYRTELTALLGTIS